MQISKSLLFVTIMGLLVAGFIAINNPNGLRIAVIFFLLIISSYVVLFTINKSIGYKSNFFGQIRLGIIFGIVFILLTFTGFSIGLPNTEQSLGEINDFLLKGVLAPFGEEIFFRGLALVGLGLILPFGVAIVIQGVSFALYHALVYGSFALNSGAFVSAGIFGIFMGALVLYPVIFKKGFGKKLSVSDLKDWKIVSVVIVHAMINIFLISKSFVVVG